ncbi:MAG: hypothetical protein WCJ29_01430 [bacterium]
MPTTKTRLALSLDYDLEKALEQVARKANVPVATKALELLREALEIQEDVLLAQLAEERMAGKIKWLKHDSIWK